MTKDTNKIYTFLDFQVNPQQRIITQDNQAVNLSKKSFDMLVVLLQRHGELITKDELLAAVWPDQFITDSALNKQIERLRKSLDLKGTNELIVETVRGVGFRLIPDVQVSVPQNTPVNPKTPIVKWIGAVFLLAIIAYFSYAFYQQKEPTSNGTFVDNIPKTKPSTESTPINIAIIPAEKTDDWLNIGGLNYLSELIQQQDGVEAINPQKSWFQEEGMASATQLLKADNIDYALVLKNIVLDGLFKSQMILRNRKGILATGNVQAESLALLFDNINLWVNQQIRINSGISSNKEEKQHLKTSNFALESYLRGLTAGENGKYKQAIKFLETAINDDQSFFPAWIMLAKVEAELGNHEKSMAIIETIQNLDNFEDGLLNHLYNAKAKSLIYLNKLDEADEILTKSIALSDQNHDMKAKITSLANQVMVHDRRGRINEGSLKILLQQLELVKKYSPLPTSIAKLNYNLSIISTELDDPEKARDYIEKAIKQYKQSSHNAIGLFASYSVLSYQHYELAQNDKALLILAEAEKLIDKVESPSVKGVFYMNKARNQGEQGYRSQAIKTLEKLSLLSAKTGAKQHKVLGYLVLIEQQIAYNDAVLAQASIKEFIEYVSETQEDYQANVGYLATFDMYISARYDEPELARKKVNTYLIAHPEMKDYLAYELKRIEAHIRAKEGFTKEAASELTLLMEYYLGNGRIMEALHVGYEVLDLQWLNDMKGFESTLNKVQEFATFDYPIIKFRAMYNASNKNFVNAAFLMQELKPKARDFWSIDDQLLLEQYQQMAHNK